MILVNILLMTAMAMFITETILTRFNPYSNGSSFFISTNSSWGRSNRTVSILILMDLPFLSVLSSESCIISIYSKILL